MGRLMHVFIILSRKLQKKMQINLTRFQKPTWLLLLILAIGCSTHTEDKIQENPFAHIQDKKAAEVLEKAFNTAGGLEDYRNMKTISYEKRSVLFLEDGSTESDLTQQHSYTLQPELIGDIIWKSDGNSYRIHYSAQDTYKEENGVRIPDSEESARKSFFSATYVLLIPFKLLDPGAKLTYEGRDTLDRGKIADVIRAEYDADKHDNHSTSEVWWYYFDAKDGAHLSSLVFHPPTYAYIENDAITDEHDIRFNIYRKTFRTDASRNKEYLRGEFYYYNYVINAGQ
ncbi:MAG: hypothetical protein DRI69_04290 [Bacteroidetes bacterium]|nr:MAG: hypothetical protein DRI69_04290 [Bacteroidota bacterium]